MGAISGLWRWRHNPLRRPTDLAEAWVALVALVLIAVAAPVAGCLVGAAAQDSLQRSVREQRHTRHLVTATVMRDLGETPRETDPDTTPAREIRRRVLADWTAPDGTHRHGPALADLKSPHTGAHFGLWTDPHGRITTRPLDSPTATTHAVLAGMGAALLTAGLVEGGRRLTVWRMIHGRYARWDQAWDRAGPDWGKAGTGC
ncbi:Rv1733c family protein [Streptomyces puniciscabiei]|uniref:Rv1733c family protein n=1 Tax=Streptomyces puniciscabiei TaxID=164348 RepID=UPI0033340C9B